MPDVEGGSLSIAPLRGVCHCSWKKISQKSLTRVYAPIPAAPPNLFHISRLRAKNDSRTEPRFSDCVLITLSPIAGQL